MEREDAQRLALQTPHWVSPLLQATSGVVERCDSPRARVRNARGSSGVGRAGFPLTSPSPPEFTRALFRGSLPLRSTEYGVPRDYSQSVSIIFYTRYNQPVLRTEYSDFNPSAPMGSRAKNVLRHGLGNNAAEFRHFTLSRSQNMPGDSVIRVNGRPQPIVCWNRRWLALRPPPVGSSPRASAGSRSAIERLLAPGPSSCLASPHFSLHWSPRPNSVAIWGFLRFPVQKGAVWLFFFFSPHGQCHPFFFFFRLDYSSHFLGRPS